MFVVDEINLLKPTLAKKIYPNKNEFTVTDDMADNDQLFDSRNVRLLARASWEVSSVPHFLTIKRGVVTELIRSLIYIKRHCYYYHDIITQTIFKKHYCLLTNSFFI